MYSILNIGGLAIGIGACLVIFLIVRFELGFDSFQPDRDRIYRVYSQFSGTFEAINSGVPTALPAFVQIEFTGIEAAAAFRKYSAKVKIVGEKQPKVLEAQQDIALAGPEYFDVFQGYQWLAGSPQQSLAAPFQVVLTETKARLYFGVSDATQALGRRLDYDDSLTVTVAGLVKDLPQPTDFIFRDFISFSTIRQSWLKNDIQLDDWGNTSSDFQYFIKLKTKTLLSHVQAQMPQLGKRYAADNKDADWQVAYRLQPLSDLHFNAELKLFDHSRLPANLNTLRLLSLVAVLLLLIAVINFVNLITAQASRRAKEVGVRKVLGSTRRELMEQFLCETTLLTSAAVLLSLMLAENALRLFQEFIPIGVTLQLSDVFTWGFLLAILLAVSLLSGVYPAFVLSSFAPVLALKNQAYASTSQTRSAFLRKSLIVFQFSVAQVLILGTFTIGWQIDFMLNKEMGFDKDAIVSFHTPWLSDKDNEKQQLLLKRQLTQLPEVAAISQHESMPASDGYSSNILEYDNGKEIVKHRAYCKFGDTAYLSLYNIPLLAGRNFHASDTAREFVINETYARLLGFRQPQQALGKMLKINNSRLPIVGVAKDFHIQSLHNLIQPVIIASQTDGFGTFSLKLATHGKGTNEFKAAIEKISQRWKQVYPNEGFSYTFVDDSIAKFYEAEQRTSKLSNTATAIAILISCMGLFGLATYTAETRTKEIGIRKVLGATVVNIVSLLSRDFLQLVLLANIIAWPVAWWAMNQWLADYAYRESIGWWLFAIAGSLALLIAILTVGYQAIKAALANPANSLRTE